MPNGGIPKGPGVQHLCFVEPSPAGECDISSSPPLLPPLSSLLSSSNCVLIPHPFPKSSEHHIRPASCCRSVLSPFSHWLMFTVLYVTRRLTQRRIMRCRSAHSELLSSVISHEHEQTQVKLWMCWVSMNVSSDQHRRRSVESGWCNSMDHVSRVSSG